MTVSCIDISHHQGSNIDFKAVRKAGVVAMIHKATEGTSYIDDMRAENIINATKAGIACCTYHWLSPGSGAQSQMEFYLSVIDPVEGERLVIDYEENGCTLDQLHEAVEFLLRDKRGFQITIYSGHLLKEQLNGSYDQLLSENTDLWLAQYCDADEVVWSTGTYPEWTLWQYSETGNISGIGDQNVDLDEFNGTPEELVEWISPFQKKPKSELDLVLIDISLPEGIAVSIKINGIEIEP
jgi:lysozyme